MLSRASLPLAFSILMLVVLACGGDGPPGEASAAEDTTRVSEGPDIHAEAPLLKVGHCRHDHHSAVFIAQARGEEMREEHGIYLEPLGEAFYALMEDGEKVAELEFVPSPGAMNIPNNMVSGQFELGFGGVIPFAASADQGTGIRIVAPMHTGGDMLVVPADSPVEDWEGFLEWVEESREPVVVGYKSPKAVALLIFESALENAGVAYSYHGNEQPGSKVVLFNAQGLGNLNPSLQNGTIDAYIANNPSCALAEDSGIGRCIAELEDLPPGEFQDHPCCAIAATSEVLEEKPGEVESALRLFAAATDWINANPEAAAETVAEALGNPVEVELASMATSGYDWRPTDAWYEDMNAIVCNMRELGTFSGPLTEPAWEENLDLITDFSHLPPEN
ncbi:MAG: ABC transporter substrate-binding protein [Candidatus Fermentibacteraceae bacterium]